MYALIAFFILVPHALYSMAGRTPVEKFDKGIRHSLSVSGMCSKSSPHVVAQAEHSLLRQALVSQLGASTGVQAPRNSMVGGHRRVCSVPLLNLKAVQARDSARLVTPQGSAQSNNQIIPFPIGSSKYSSTGSVVEKEQAELPPTAVGGLSPIISSSRVYVSLQWVCFDRCIQQLYRIIKTEDLSGATSRFNTEQEKKQYLKGILTKSAQLYDGSVGQFKDLIPATIEQILNEKFAVSSTDCMSTVSSPPTLKRSLTEQKDLREAIPEPEPKECCVIL